MSPPGQKYNRAIRTSIQIIFVVVVVAQTELYKLKSITFHQIEQQMRRWRGGGWGGGVIRRLEPITKFKYEL